MPVPLISSFDCFESAAAARDALVAAGWPPPAVELRILEDEAGPVEGNFLVGNARPAAGVQRPAAEGVLGGLEVPYDLNFARTVSRGVHLLLVESGDDGRREEAHAILGRFGARPALR